MIDTAARVADGARIGDGVEIGPYCVVGPDVTLGDGVRLMAHVHVTGVTTIGAGTVVYPFASLGTPPQSVHYRGGATRLIIGPKCQIRENVTVNTGTEDGGGVTTVGERCFLMVGSHIAHDCHVGNGVIFANLVTLGGHVSVGDDAFFGGLAAAHQFRPSWRRCHGRRPFRHSWRCNSIRYCPPQSARWIECCRFAAARRE